MNYLMIFIGGGVGSLCRYAIGQLVSKNYSSSYPAGTFLANFVSCVVLGLLVSWFLAKSNLDSNLRFLLVVGFCGGFSTFSTFTLEVFDLLKVGNYQIAFLYIITSIVLCLIGFFAGYKLYNLNELV